MRSFEICPICKLPEFRTLALCRHCGLQLRRMIHPTVRAGPRFTARSLFSWSATGPKGLDELVYALKGQEDPTAWLEPALWMREQFSNRLIRPTVIPVPSRQGEPNHALGLARALARVLGCPLSEALIHSGGGAQKYLTRSERGGLKFMARASPPCTSYKSVLIVDDVITTGATAGAAVECLRPKSCEIWCLMDRRPCGM